MRRLLPVFALFLLAGCAETGGGDETARKFVVFFRHGDASITPSAQTVINTVATIAKRHPNRQVLVAGFAAAHGNLDADEELSAQRAELSASVDRALAKGLEFRPLPDTIRATLNWRESIENELKAVAGIRIAEWLAGGKSLEIEDLVSTENERSKGFGGALFDWIVDYAKSENCDHIKLVSHVTRFGAHKFYLNKGMKIEAHYFSLKL